MPQPSISLRSGSTLTITAGEAEALDRQNIIEPCDVCQPGTHHILHSSNDEEVRAALQTFRGGQGRPKVFVQIPSAWCN